MNWSDVGGMIAGAAPSVGAALGGPTGAAIGSAVASLLGVDATPEAVAAKVNAEPASALELKKLEADLQKTIVSAQAEVIKADATGESWLQRNWRPMLMLWFAMLVGGYWFGFTPDGLSDSIVGKLFDIVQFGLTGFIAGRSIEKVTKTASDGGAFIRK